MTLTRAIMNPSSYFPSSGAHRVCVALVHGTWASNAQWTHEDSSLRRELERRAGALGMRVDFSISTWSGSNGMESRARATEQLRAHLASSISQNPTAPHFVIAHSHGGNIALRSIEDQRGILGVVTLSTPFISASPSPAMKLLLFSIFLPALLLGIVLFGISWGYVLPVSRFLVEFVSDIFPLLGGLFSIVGALIAFLLCLKIGSFPVVLWAVIYRALKFKIRETQEHLASRFNLAGRKMCAVLAIRFWGDEALVCLRVARYLVRPARLFSMTGMFLCCVYALALLFSPALGLVLLLVPESLVELALGVIALTLPIGVILIFLSFPVWLLGEYLLINMTLGNWGGMYHGFLMDFRVDSKPHCTDVELVTYKSNGGGKLRHSMTYSDRRAVEQVASWIVARAAKAQRGIS